ncbi:MAG: 50S ribosomal protein L27, partial [Saprospiraceae bacterium]
MAHKKGVGSTDNGRDSNPKYLGVKLFGGQTAKAGNIIIRQRGTKYHAGENVYLGRDFTVHAKVDGTVVFNKRKNNRTYVSIIPADAADGGAVATQPRKEVKAATPVVEKVAETLGEAVGTVTATAQGIASNVADLAEKTVKTGKTEKIALPSGKKFKVDDLKIVEGIGPKIEQLLNEGGINTWQELADSKVETLQGILDAAGSRYRVHNPSTWAQQAQLCVDGNWTEL